MGKGHERLHARTRLPADEMGRRWDRTFGGALGIDAEDSLTERTNADAGSTPAASTDEPCTHPNQEQRDGRE